MSDLPNPLTPADADLQEFAFMPLDVGRIRDSDLAALSSGDEFRCAVLLWCAAWHQLPAGSLPDDDKVLAQLAGFGRVVKEWRKCRAGALRNWIKCADERLYHPVVAEKVNEAWAGRVRYAEKKEAERLRKAEERRLKKLADEALAQRGSPLDDSALSEGQRHDTPHAAVGLPPENTLTVDSRQWTVDSGQLTSKASGGGGGTVPDQSAAARVAPPLPIREKPPLSEDPAVLMSAMLRRLGVDDALFTHPAVKAWTEQGVPDAILEAAVANARGKKGPDAKIPANYLVGIVDDLLNPTPLAAAPARAEGASAWKYSANGIEKKGKAVGLTQGPHELHRDFAVRIEAELANRQGAPA